MKWKDVLPPNIASTSNGIGCYNAHIALKFDGCFATAVFTK